jgi:UDP-glucose 4-epimerase
MYTNDMARAIAMLQTAEKLQHNIYNVGSETVLPNLGLLDTIRRVVPQFQIVLLAGRSPFLRPVMETKRLEEDTGFRPKFDIYTAIRDYVEWLRAGNPK